MYIAFSSFNHVLVDWSYCYSEFIWFLSAKGLFLRSFTTLLSIIICFILFSFFCFVSVFLCITLFGCFFCLCLQYHFRIFVLCFFPHYLTFLFWFCVLVWFSFDSVVCFVNVGDSCIVKLRGGPAGGIIWEIIFHRNFWARILNVTCFIVILIQYCLMFSSVLFSSLITMLCHQCYM